MARRWFVVWATMRQMRCMLVLSPLRFGPQGLFHVLAFMLLKLGRLLAVHAQGS